MQLSIRIRLFLAILAATALVAVGMLLIMQWSINRGFLQFVNTLDQERFERLAVLLEESYDARQGWEELSAEPRRLLPLLLRTLPEGELPPEHLARLERRLAAGRGRDPFDPHAPPPPGGGNRFEFRVQLFDAEQRLLLGPTLHDGAGELRPLRRDGRVIGYLGLLPQRDLSDVRQLRFLRQQKLALLLVAGLMLAVSALLALPLAGRLLRPIRALAAATRGLAAGDYASRVPVATQDELGQLAGDFNRLARTLEENENSRRQWVADISHELRTPLAVLRGEIEALQDGVRPSSPAALASLHGEVLRLARLVDDLHQLSLADLGALQYRKESVDLRALLDAALAPLRAAASEDGLTLAVELESDCPVFADPQRLQQLFANLCDNALKYTDRPGCIEVRLQRRGMQALFAISDSAPGVPAAELGRLFERLYRVEGSRNRASGGSGLGLAICRSIVAAHDGEISAAASPTGGVTIRVRLPLERRTP
jgi:two-component system sensor histidine kinase BaeS